jgi:VIT1/CCC1 family predicted Fe2+/Mn2+ transporter
MADVSDAGRVRRYRELLASERDAAVLYRAMADADTGPRSDVFGRLAEIEERHAAHWESRLREAGADVPSLGAASTRTRILGWLARRFSTSAVLPFVERAEHADAGKYDAEPDAAVGMAADERGHARQLAKLRSPRPSAPEQIARRERWHRGDRSGALRAGVFGVSDGLVSNAALVMGFAGSGAPRSTVVLAGVAGLLAGSFSMAAGEYVSMSSQREMFEREISLEAQELDEQPDEEREELALLYQAKGLPPEEARQLADRLMSDREVALDTLAREELGLDPEALGSPWSAAVSSMIAFAVGAAVALVPYLFAAGTAALVTAIVAVTVALFVVGGGIGLLNGRSVVRSGLRQVFVGGLAAGVTFVVGHLLGASVS